ncbi:MAG: capsule assembly Wzi family protein [Gammaproteobacteria bacterium]
MPAVSLLVSLACSPAASFAGPWIDPGDIGLRNDIQLLADAGVIGSPVTQWPLSWGDILSTDVVEPENLSDAEAAALVRVQRLARRARRTGDWRPAARLAVGSEALALRDFSDTPREAAEAELQLEWTGERTAIRLRGQYAADAEDGQDWRADGSYAGLALGNWMVAAAMTDRWWGPGWQSSLILSNNARPIPAFTIDRNSTAPFESKWLSWIGHWDFVALWGFLESDRAVPDARYFAMRATVRPARFLEFGLSRAAMWCGSGRPCGFSTFKDLLFGKDNVGDNVSAEDEPGNQLGGYDIRLNTAQWGIPFAIYSQRIGEDEQNLRPALFLTQFGIESWGTLGSLGSLRAYLEVSDTLCNGNVTGGGVPNTCYNHSTYATGMRYRGRTIGHTADNDAKIWTLGLLLNDSHDASWALTLKAGELNRVGEPDSANTVTPIKQKYLGADLLHARALWLGTLRAGLGVESRKTTLTNQTDDDWRVFLEWRQQW